MYDNPEQAKLASLIISIVILIIIVVLIVVVCCNWNSLNNTNTTTQPLVQNPQALAAAAMYKNNQGMNVANAANAIRNNPQKAALGAYAYNQNKNNFDAQQRIRNIQSAKQNPGGASDWANFIQAGTSKTAAQNMYNNFGKTYQVCYTTGKGTTEHVVCNTYTNSPKNQLMGYNHQRLANIQSAKQNPGGASDWANFIQAGTAKADAKYDLYVYQNNGCPMGSHLTQVIVPGVCGIKEITTYGVTTHCSGTQVYGACAPNSN